MTFSERLHSLRRKRGFSQKQLAKKIHISKSAISSYETQKALPSIDVLVILANFFDVSTDYLLCRTDYPKRITVGLGTFDNNTNDYLEITNDIINSLENHGYSITHSKDINNKEHAERYKNLLNV